MKKHFYLGLCLMIVAGRLHADSYVLDPSPMMPSGMKAETPFYEPNDASVCKVYLRNLQYHAKRNIPMSCERPIAPHLGDRLRKMEWQDLSPAKFPDLFRAIVAKHRYWNTNPPKDEIGRLSTYANKVMEKAYAFRRAKLMLQGYPDYARPDRPRLPRQGLWLVQYGPNTADTHNPNPALRCESQRGGPRHEIWSDLKLYLASADMKTVFREVQVLENGGSGEALWIVNGSPYLETVLPNGNIQLMQLNQDYPGTLEPICFYLFSQPNR